MFYCRNFVKSVKRLRISHSTINGASSNLVGAKDSKKMHYITKQFVDFVNAQRLRNLDPVQIILQFPTNFLQQIEPP